MWWKAVFVTRIKNKHVLSPRSTVTNMTSRWRWKHLRDAICHIQDGRWLQLQLRLDDNKSIEPDWPYRHIAAERNVVFVSPKINSYQRDYLGGGCTIKCDVLSNDTVQSDTKKRIITIENELCWRTKQFESKSALRLTRLPYMFTI